VNELLSIRGLTAGYGELEVLRNFSMSVKKGEIVALIGPNGAGKSTVLKAIFSLADVRKGKIVFKRKTITHLPTHEHIRRGVSFVTQGRVVFDHLTIRENLEVGAEIIRNKKEVERRISAVFNRFPVLEERQQSLGFQLSGGQRQMLALGRALMQNPSLLLLDEPSLGLSPKLQKEIFQMIARLRDEGIAILVVEQNAKKAMEIADRTYLLEDGVVALSGGVDILSNEKIRDVYLGGRY